MPQEALSRRRTIIENLASSLEVTGLVARGHHAYEAQLCERRLEGVHPVASVATQTLLEDIDVRAVRVMHEILVLTLPSSFGAL